MNNVDKYPPGSFQMHYTFDFFNYAGIHRPVTLYTKPKKLFIRDITILTKNVDPIEQSATLKYDIELNIKAHSGLQCTVKIVNAKAVKVYEFHTCQDEVELKNVHLWWPYLLTNDTEPAYLYTMEVWVHSTTYGTDVYRQEFGVRQVTWDANNIYVNNK